MVYNKQFFFDELIHPGLTLEELLESKNMTQKELSERIGVTPKHITSIINGKNGITPDLALKLEKVFGITASFWNNLQKSYEEDKIKLEENKILELEKEQVSKYTSYRKLSSLGFVKETRSKVEKLKELLNFFGVFSLSALPKLPGMAFRKYDQKISEENFRMWIKAGEILSEKIEVEDFSKNKLKSIIPELKKLTFDKKINIKKIEELFSSCGIKFSFVESFEKVPVVGITRKYRGIPLVQISDRGKKHDIFWFTLFHEIGHTLLHLSSKNDMFIDFGKEGTTDIEKEADEFAQKHLSEGVDESIIAGRISHEVGNWAQMNKFRKKLEVV